MAVGKPPKRQFSFKDHSANQPSTPIPGDRLDLEFDRITQAFEALISHFGTMFRPDGTLRNQSVLKDHLKAGIFNDQEQKFSEIFDKYLEQIQSADQSSQRFSIEAKSALNKALDSVAAVHKALGDVERLSTETEYNKNQTVQQRSRVEAASTAASVRASDAETSANSARIAEDMAYRWAEKMDGPVFVPSGGDAVDDGFYSSKWWAKYTETSVNFGSYWYLGPHPTSPTEGNGGVPLEPGMWYFNTTANIGFIWDGTQWNAMTASSLVVSVFGRDGLVTAEEADYAEFYAPIVHTHTESQITDLDKYTKNEVDALQQTQDQALTNHTSDTNNPHRTTWDTLLGKPGTFPPSAHTHVEAGITDLNRIRWRDTFVLGTQYLRNDFAHEGDYSGVANKDTQDHLAPQLSGDPEYVYKGTIGRVSVPAKQVVFGVRYDVQNGGFRVDGYRVNVVGGNEYTVFLIDDPLTDPVVTQIATLTPSTDGWVELGYVGDILEAGAVFDLLVRVNEPDPVTVKYTLNYDYSTPNNTANPSAGQIVHASKSDFELRVSKTTNNGDPTGTLPDDANGDQTPFAWGLITVGDIIDGAGIRWSVQSVSDNGSWFAFGIAPITQGITGNGQDFIFETVVIGNITVPRDDDLSYWDTVGFSQVAGLLFQDAAYDPAITNRSAYGIDLFIQQMNFSEDWDLLPTGGRSSGGSDGGGGVTDLISLTDTPASYAGQANNFLAVKSDETGTEFVDGDAKYARLSGANNVFDSNQVIKNVSPAWITVEADENNAGWTMATTATWHIFATNNDGVFGTIKYRMTPAADLPFGDCIVTRFNGDGRYAQSAAFKALLIELEATGAISPTAKTAIEALLEVEDG